MTLSDLDQDLILCEEHLEKTNSKGTEIESFLTRFLLVHICGAYEKEIKRIIIERARGSGHQELASFVEKTIEPYRNLKTSDIKGKILNRFSDKYANSFHDKINGTEEETRYQNIIINRDLAAHGESINITFKELVESHKLATGVLRAISEAISS